MTAGSKIVYTGVFAGVFLLIMIIGLASGVSWPACVSRAVLAALVFTALTWLVGTVMKVWVMPDASGPDVPENSLKPGGNLDITVGENPAEDFTARPERPVVENCGPDNAADRTVNGQETFSPLAAKQIDPQLTRIINSDPDKMAEIVRKMGFEEK